MIRMIRGTSVNQQIINKNNVTNLTRSKKSTCALRRKSNPGTNAQGQNVFSASALMLADKMPISDSAQMPTDKMPSNPNLLRWSTLEFLEPCNALTEALASMKLPGMSTVAISRNFTIPAFRRLLKHFQNSEGDSMAQAAPLKLRWNVFT